MTDINTNISEHDSTIDGGFDIKAILSKILTYWYLFVLSILICFSLAVVNASLTGSYPTQTLTVPNSINGNGTVNYIPLFNTSRI